MIVAGFCIVGIASLLLLPVSEAHPAALTITMIGAFCGIGAMLSAAATLALEALPHHAGMASGIMGSFQSLLGAVFSLALAFVDANSLLLLHLSTAGCAGLMGLTILATRRLAPLSNRETRSPAWCLCIHQTAKWPTRTPARIYLHNTGLLLRGLCLRRLARPIGLFLGGKYLIAEFMPANAFSCG